MSAAIQDEFKVRCIRAIGVFWRNEISDAQEMLDTEGPFFRVYQDKDNYRTFTPDRFHFFFERVA